MIPQSPLEKVARAIDAEAWAFYDRHIGNPIMGAECLHETAPSLALARVVLATLLEPDPVMFSAIGYRGLNKHRDTPQHIANSFNAAIQHILKGKAE